MDFIGYVVWNPEKETYLTVRHEWAHRVQHAAVFEKHANAMRAIKDIGISGLRVLEKFFRIDTLTHKIPYGGYEWLTKDVDPIKIEKLGGKLSGTRNIIVEFPEFEIRFYQGDSYFTVSGASVEDFTSIIKEKLKDHE